MPTGKAIVHWIECINAIKLLFLIELQLSFVISPLLNLHIEIVYLLNLHFQWSHTVASMSKKKKKRTSVIILTWINTVGNTLQEKHILIYIHP